VLSILADDSRAAALSALFWWIIPITALIGAIGYVIWVSKFKSKFENQVDRSVGRFRKFQGSFPDNSPYSTGTQKSVRPQAAEEGRSDARA